MNELRAWIDKLGGMSTPDIRKLMRDEGIKGYPGSWSNCPLARFLSLKVGYPVSVATTVTSLNDGDVLVPESMDRFLESFDSCEYPDLIDESPMA